MSATQESLVDPTQDSDSEAHTTDTGGANQELGFGEALAEIETILAKIEGDEVDIDELATALGRAAELLELCRTKIRRAEREVEQVSQRLAPEEPG